MSVIERYQRRAPLLMAALVCLFGLGSALAYLLWVCTAPGQYLDIVGFGRAQSWNGLLERPAGIARRAIPIALLVTAVVLAVLPSPPERGRARLREILSVGVSIPLVMFLRSTLPRPDLGSYGYDYNTFPSGHVAVATALTLAVIGLWPRAPRPRWLFTAGGIVVGVACLSSVIGHAHRPSDTVGAVLVVLTVHTLAAWVTGPVTRAPRP